MNQVMVSARQSPGVRSHTIRQRCQSWFGMPMLLPRPLGSLQMPPGEAGDVLLAFVLWEEG